MSDECKLDDKGNCTEHGPGTEGEARRVNAMTLATYEDFQKAMGAVAATGLLLTMIGSAPDALGARAVALRTIVEPVARAMIDAAKALKALIALDTHPAPEASTSQN